MLLPAVTGSGESVLEMVSTGTVVTVVVIDAPLTGAVCVQSMLYVPLEMIVPPGTPAPTWTTSCTDPEDPAFRAPVFQVTTPAARVPPPVALTNVVLTGIVSVITVPVALALPVFE